MAFVSSAYPSLSYGQSSPGTIDVQLFESMPNLHMVEVDGPFEMLGSETRHFPAGAYYFYRHERFEGRSCPQGCFSGGTNGSGALKLERLVEGKVIALSGVSGEPLPTRTSNGPHKYLGVVTFRCHRSLGLSGQMQCVLSVINRLDRRHYVESVVGSETLPNWPAEVLKAQAVLVQTLLARRDPKMPLGDSTQCMLYEGSDYARKETVSAVSAVWNKCLLYKGTPIQVFYNPTCGGRTSSAFAVFGSAAKGFTYLPSVKCDFCKDAPLEADGTLCACGKVCYRIWCGTSASKIL